MLKTLLLLTGSCVVTGTGHAQSTADADAKTAQINSPSDASASQPANADAAPDYGDNSIVVTASKRAETIQNTSMAVSAVTGDSLREQNITDVKGLQTLAPTLTVGDDNGAAKIFMRGIGLNTSTSMAEAGVAVYVDGAVISRPEAQLTAFFDLDRVEVVRGPQGTLYGRNAVGGAVNLITAKPTFQPEGFVEATYGSYNELDVTGAVSGPITDTLAARASFRTENRDGFGTFVGDGRDVDNNNRKMARLQLLYKPSSDFSWLLSGQWFHEDDASGAPHLGALAYPGTVFVPTGIGGYATNPRDGAGDFRPFYKTDTWSVTSTATWQANDWLSLVDIANYRKFNEFHGYDYDNSLVANFPSKTGRANGTHQKGSSSEQVSNELQFHTDWDHVKGVIGLFYFHEKLGSFVRYGIGNTNSAFGPPENASGVAASGIPIESLFEACALTDLASKVDLATVSIPNLCTHARHTTDAYSIFGQYLFDLGLFTPALEGLSLKVGGRYNRERRAVYNPGATASPTTANLIAAGVGSKVFKDFTPELGFEWKINPDLLLYYTYSEGFKSGVGEPFSPGTNRLIDPETIQNHEVGLKATLLGGRASFNVAAFKYDLQGLQIQRTRSFGGDPNAPPIQVFENATGVAAKGIEIEARYAPIRTIRFNVGLAYLDSHFTDFVTQDSLDPVAVLGPTNNGGPKPFINLKGNPTRNSPKFSGNASVAVDLMRRNDKSLTAELDGFYRSTTYYSEFKRLAEGQKGFAMLDVALRYRAGPLSASAWVKNLTNKLAIDATYASTVNGIIGRTFYPPRTYGVTVGYDF